MPAANNLRTKVNRLIEGYGDGFIPPYALVTRKTYEALRESGLVITNIDQTNKIYLNHDRPSAERIELLIFSEENTEKGGLPDLIKDLVLPLILSKSQKANGDSIACDLFADYEKIDEVLLNQE